MPNWCHNRVTAYGDEDKIEKVKKIFESKTPFNDIFPQPDWKNTPNEKGELPVLEQHKHPETGKVVWETYNFPDGKNDDRWYHWCIDNWGTKWEADVTGFEVQDYDTLEIEFQTAWSPPEGVVTKLREKFPELSFQCFYDEPGMGIAGYYQDSLISVTQFAHTVQKWVIL